MKNNLFLYPFLVAVMVCTNAFSQHENTGFLYGKSDWFSAFFCQKVDSITFQNIKEGRQQCIWTQDSVYQIPVSQVDSLSFVAPEQYAIDWSSLFQGDWTSGVYTGGNHILSLQKNGVGWTAYLREYRDEIQGFLIHLNNQYQIVSICSETGLLELNYGKDGRQATVSFMESEGRFVAYGTIRLETANMVENKLIIPEEILQTTASLKQLNHALLQSEQLQKVMSDEWYIASARVVESIENGKIGNWLGEAPKKDFHMQWNESYAALEKQIFAIKQRGVKTLLGNADSEILNIKSLGNQQYEIAVSVKHMDSRWKKKGIGVKCGLLLQPGKSVDFQNYNVKSHWVTVEKDGKVSLTLTVPDSVSTGLLVPVLVPFDIKNDGLWDTYASYGATRSLGLGTDLVMGNVYYVDGINGDDNGAGTSPQNAYKSLSALPHLSWKAGDRLFLKKGATYRGSIHFEGVQGTEEAPFIVTSYGKGNAPALIDAQGQLAGIEMYDCSHFQVIDLAITGNGSGGRKEDPAPKEKMRCGILCKATRQDSSHHLRFSRLDIHDIFALDEGIQRDPGEVHTPNGTASYGYGIRIFNNIIPENRMNDIVIEHCKVSNVSHTGIKISAKNKNISKVDACYNEISHTGGPGMQMGQVQDVHVHHNSIDHSGSQRDSRNWQRGSGYWCFASDRVLFEYNRMTNANGPQDSAGAHIDYNCSNVIYQYNFSANNLGAFCEILGNGYNCCYRYNVSVNDGQREKKGNSLFISGYVGKGPHKGPFHTYVYNNTIYVGEGKQSGIELDRSVDGLLVANNIFYVEGTAVSHTSKKPLSALVKHNLFLDTKSWHPSIPVKDDEATYGNPQFLHAGGINISDYIPQNVEIVKDKGCVIDKLPNDSIGLYLGLPVEKDILGRPIKGLPDFGAIEME